jgi:hypothetical protein
MRFGRTGADFDGLGLARIWMGLRLEVMARAKYRGFSVMAAKCAVFGLDDVDLEA